MLSSSWRNGRRTVEGQSLTRRSELASALMIAKSHFSCTRSFCRLRQIGQNPSGRLCSYALDDGTENRSWWRDGLTEVVPGERWPAPQGAGKVGLPRLAPAKRRWGSPRRKSGKIRRIDYGVIAEVRRSSHSRRTSMLPILSRAGRDTSGSGCVQQAQNARAAPRCDHDFGHEIFLPKAIGSARSWQATPPYLR